MSVSETFANHDDRNRTGLAYLFGQICVRFFLSQFSPAPTLLSVFITYNVVIITTVYATTTTAYFFQLSSHTARLRFHYVRSQWRTRDTYDYYHYYYHYYYYYTLGRYARVAEHGGSTGDNDDSDVLFFFFPSTPSTRDSTGARVVHVIITRSRRKPVCPGVAAFAGAVRRVAQQRKRTGARTM